MLLLSTLNIIIPVAALVVGLALGYLVTATLLKKAVTKEADAYLEEAKEKAEVIKKERILQAKEKFLQMKDEHEKACNERKTEVFDIGYAPMKYGERAKDGSLLRPFIVWFGEPVPEIERAATECMEADIFIIIGTSLNVYPAAGLTQYVPPTAPIYLIDPKPVQWNSIRNFRHIMKGASEGMKELMAEIGNGVKK